MTNPLLVLLSVVFFLAFTLAGIPGLILLLRCKLVHPQNCGCWAGYFDPF